ncbi:DUF4157 domain-containing protein [Streptomyces rimosus]|nr:DUF4157 domain-containing protein [Streptomyces rimosus]
MGRLCRRCTERTEQGPRPRDTGLPPGQPACPKGPSHGGVRSAPASVGRAGVPWRLGGGSVRSHGHEHESGRGGGPGSSRVSQDPVGLNAHWLRHSQRVASGGVTAEETEDHAQVQPAAVDKAIRSASHPLDAAFRQDMEARGIQRATLDAIQVHSGLEARDAAALVNAKAFTTEHHIVDGGNMTRAPLPAEWRGRCQEVAQGGQGHA